MTLEETIIHYARLGLKGDTKGVARLTKQLLRRTAKDESIAVPTRTELARLVAEGSASSLRFVQPQPATAGSLVEIEAEVEGDEPLLSDAVAKNFARIVRERERADELASVGLVPTRTVLLTGPPGVGKTLTARALARRLKVPLISVDMAALMSSYLGKTGRNLSEALSKARQSPCVMLLDEFDAIAKRRDDPSDIGELKRIVTVLLLELDSWPASSLLVASTNHPELLDRAIWRRFEMVVEIDLPTSHVRRLLFERELSALHQTVDREVLDACVDATVGASGSEILRIVHASVRRSILGESDLRRTLIEEAVAPLRARAANEKVARVLYCRVCSDKLGMSLREIATQLGISHVMVGKILKSPPVEMPGAHEVPNV